MKSTPDTPTQLAGSALTQQSGGPGGHSSLPLWHASSYPPGAFSLGPLQRNRLGRRSRHGPSGPRRKCGVRRREPLCGATGVYQIKGAPAALCAVGNKREWGAGKHPSWRGLAVRPLAARISWAALCAEIICGPGPQILRPPQGSPLSRAVRGMYSAWKRFFKKCALWAQRKGGPRRARNVQRLEALF